MGGIDASGWEIMIVFRSFALGLPAATDERATRARSCSETSVEVKRKFLGMI